MKMTPENVLTIFSSDIKEKGNVLRKKMVPHQQIMSISGLSSIL